MTGNQKTASTLHCLTQTNIDSSLDQIYHNYEPSKVVYYICPSPDYNYYGLDQLVPTLDLILISTYINSLDTKVLFSFTET